jgi:hypothetical protein
MKQLIAVAAYYILLSVVAQFSIVLSLAIGLLTLFPFAAFLAATTLTE